MLADAETATYAELERIERVIAHEYFHNWSGNRVTCRDWFELTLKEGLTVFRDQHFSSDMTSEAVRDLTSHREDATPHSSPNIPHTPPLPPACR